MESRTFSPKDPFKPSLQYSIRNIFLGRHKDSPGRSRLSQTPYPVLEEPPRKSYAAEKSTRSQEAHNSIRGPTVIFLPTLRSPSVRPSLSFDHGRISESIHTRPEGHTRQPTVITLEHEAWPVKPERSRTRSRTTSRSSSPPSRPTRRSDMGQKLHQTSIRSASPMEDVRGRSRSVRSTSPDWTQRRSPVSAVENFSGPPIQGPLLLDDGISSQSVSDGPPVKSPPGSSKSDVSDKSQVQLVSLHGPPISVAEIVSPPLVSTKNDSPGSLLSFKATSSPPLQRSPQQSFLSLSKSHVSEVVDLPPKSASESDFDMVSLPSGTADNKPFGVEVYALAFVLDTLPRQIYLYFLLFLPSIYYSRVARIFIDAQLSVYEIDKCILDEAVDRDSYVMPPAWRPAGRHLRKHVEVWSPYGDLEEAWQSFLDSLLREWNTLNIISGLLLTAIITILQIGNAGDDPLIRYTALLSMICALMSLLYGCMYIIRFPSMRKTYKAAEWAFEADKPQSPVFWNVWVMLAMPATWLGWSIILFIACIASFIWRTGTTVDENLAPMTPHQVVSARVVVSFILALGIIYFGLIIATLQRYGDVMDKAWRYRITGWVQIVREMEWTRNVERAQPRVVRVAPERHYEPPVVQVAPERHYENQPSIIRIPSPPESMYRPHSIVVDGDVGGGWYRPGGYEREIWSPPSEIFRDAPSPVPVPWQSGTSIASDTSPILDLPLPHELTTPPGEEVPSVEYPGHDMRESSRPSEALIKITKLFDLFPDNTLEPSQETTEDSAFSLSNEQWDTLRSDIRSNWNESEPDAILPILIRWNQAFFHGHGGQICLCEELGGESTRYSVYHFTISAALPLDQANYDLSSFPRSALHRLDIWSPSIRPASDSDSRLQPDKISLHPQEWRNT